MKFNDDITMSIASTVRDVLEGKAPVKKEEKDGEPSYPHTMYNPKDGTSVKIMNKVDHDKYTKMGWSHDKPTNEVAEPEPKGEKEFKAKHVIKKSGENNDGTVTKEAKEDEPKKEGNAFTKALMAARKNGDDDFVVSGKKYKVEDYAEDEEEEVKESKDDEVDEESEKQKKYQAFFNKALKKFGVDSPSELEGDKKKEFFDYVDKNYEADNESD